ncbi:T9SS type A sorting domain-containing protein [Candidatus Latescibacterota bacterium]
MIKMTIYCMFFITFFVGFSHCELPEGRWIHHERQTPQYQITSLFPDENYLFTASTEKTHHSFDGTDWKKVAYEDQAVRDHTPFFRDSKGRLYLVESGDLLVVDHGVVTRFEDQNIWYPVVAAESSDGDIYFGLSNILAGGVYAFNGTTVEKILDGRVHSVAIDSDDQLWAAVLTPDMDSMGLMVLSSGEWQNRSDEIESLSPIKTRELTVQRAPDGSVWVNYLGNYGVLQDDSWLFHDGGPGPIFLTFDSSGGVWGYGSSTLYRLDETGDWVVSLVLDDGITNRPNYLAEDGDGDLWTIDGIHILTYHDDEWMVVENNLDLASDIVTCLVYIDDGRLMCGHGLKDVDITERLDQGISIWDGATWENYNKKDDTFLSNVYLLKRSPDDEVYAYTDDGLKIYDMDRWATVDTLKALDITDIKWQGDSDVMWISTFNGLIEYNHPSIEFMVNPEWMYPFKVFYNLNFDSEGVLYMQTNYGAIVSFYEDREEIWESHASNSPLDLDIAIDTDDKLWCARNFKLSWWDRYDRWIDVVDLPYGRMVELDEEGRIWASGYGNTGFLENGVWHQITELSSTASDVIATDGNGRFVLNAFELNTDDSPPIRHRFSGLYEYVSGTVGVERESVPEPVITASSYPNPFNPSTTISYSVPSDGKVNVSVYTISGQKVTTLVSGWAPAGSHSVVWDSRSDKGLLMASGLYFYQVSASGTTKAGKMLLVR